MMCVELQHQFLRSAFTFRADCSVIHKCASCARTIWMWAAAEPLAMNEMNFIEIRCKLIQCDGIVFQEHCTRYTPTPTHTSGSSAPHLPLASQKRDWEIIYNFCYLLWVAIVFDDKWMRTRCVILSFELSERINSWPWMMVAPTRS